MLRSIACLVCLSWVGQVRADPPPRKLPTAAYPAAARAAFEEAMRSEDAGDNQRAYNSYNASSELSKQANTAFNLGRLYLRQELTEAAIGAFEDYLRIANKAADGPVVQKLIADLKRMPPSVRIGGDAMSVDEPDALILVDGVVVGHSPVSIQPSVGTHHVERITRSTYAQSSFEANVGAISYEQVSVLESQPGNFILSSPDDQRWHDGKTGFQTNLRYDLPVGAYRSMGPPAARFCNALEFKIAPPPAITHVYARFVRDDTAKCTRVRDVRVQALIVGPP